MMEDSLDKRQLMLAFDWGHSPWKGRSLRSLTKVARGASCVVDNSVVRCTSREALRFGVDPAQLTCLIHQAPSHDGF